MIYVGENKSILYRGDFRPAELYKGDKKIAGYTATEFSGEGSVTLEKCYNDKVYDIAISEDAQSIKVRGKNYFDLNKVPFNNANTQPYKNGLIAQKNTWGNRGDKIPISLPVGKTIYITLDVVDSQISGTIKRVTMGFHDSGSSLVFSWNITSDIAHKTYSYTPTKEISYVQFYFQSDNEKNAVGDYVTMDNIMIRCEGDDAYEPYVDPRIINVGSDIPTLKGTTIIETDKGSTISGKYKKREE